MKALVIEVEFTINVGRKDRRQRGEALIKSLRTFGLEVESEVIEDSLYRMRLARAEDPWEAVLWQFFRSVARERGFNHRAMRRAWKQLRESYLGFAGYSYEERAGVRELLEALKFHSVDSWGDAPQLAAVSNYGTMAQDALEHAKLMRLFEDWRILSTAGPSCSDSRQMSDLLDGLGVPAQHCLFVGTCLERSLTAAMQLGAATVILDEGEGLALPARSESEEPAEICRSVDELGDFLHAWLNAPKIEAIL